MSQISDQDKERKEELDFTKSEFNKIYKMIKEFLPPSVIGRPNCKYDQETIMRYAMMMCANRHSHEGISELMRDKHDSSKVPSGATLLNRIGGSSVADTHRCCDQMLNSTLTNAIKSGLFKQEVITATDDHDIPVHFKELDDDFINSGKPKSGTSKMYRFNTTKVVNNAAGVTLSIHPAGKNKDKADIIQYSLEKIRELGINSWLHLLDRGFFTVGTMNRLIKMDQLFIMPAFRTPGIIRAIVGYHNKKVNTVSRYTVRGKAGSVTITLVIIRRKDAKEDEPISKQYNAFVTNADVSVAYEMLEAIPDEYKRRWGIETGYRCAKQIRPFTCSKNPSIRLMLFYLSMILYNVWVLVNWFASGGRTKCGGVYTRPPITLYRMMEAFKDACIKMIIAGVITEMFFVEAPT